MVSKIMNFFNLGNKDISNKVDDSIELATQRQLIWRRFKRHRFQKKFRKKRKNH